MSLLAIFSSSNNPLFLEHDSHTSTGKSLKNGHSQFFCIFCNFSSLTFPVESNPIKRKFVLHLVKTGVEYFCHKLGVEREKKRIFYFSNHRRTSCSFIGCSKNLVSMILLSLVEIWIYMK